MLQTIHTPWVCGLIRAPSKPLQPSHNLRHGHNLPCRIEAFAPWIGELAAIFDAASSAVQKQVELG